MSVKLAPPHPEDASIVHAPGECKTCDDFPDWQTLRSLWNITYTGRTPKPGQVRCPSTLNRPHTAEHCHHGANHDG